MAASGAVPDGGAETVIEVAGLTKTYGTARVVDDLSFGVRRGVVTGFLGPNGSGKTTTLKMLLGLVRPDAGSATVLGRPYAALDDPARQVGSLLEANQFHPGRTGRASLRVAARPLDLPAARVEEVLELVGLADAARKRVGKYSLGMRQRLGLAQALLPDPPVLVLDEPVNGLDPQGIRALRELLRAFAAEGRAILVSSHLLTEVAQTVDRVVVIRSGSLVADTTLAELTAGSAGQTVRVRSPQAAALHAALAERGLHPTPVGPDTMSVAGIGASEVGDLMAAHGWVTHLLVEEGASLEQVYLTMTSPGGTAPGEGRLT